MRDWFTSGESEKSRSVLFGIVLGALVVSLAWMVLPDVVGSGSGSAGTVARHQSAYGNQGSGGQPSNIGASQAGGSQGNSDSPLARCREVYAAQAPPMRSAASAMTQWQVHIAAMNKLVLGVITLQQANQFWNSTRVGAHARLHRFAAADAKFRRQTVRCPAPGGGSGPRRLRRCERAVAADARVLGLARTALGTWGRHVKDMEMLRMGKMSPTKATQMWMQTWHQGQHQVVQYRAAVDATRGLGCR